MRAARGESAARQLNSESSGACFARPDATMSDRPGGATCPFCGALGCTPSDMDAWWCPNCKREHPTIAFKCQQPDCWEYVFLEPFCERHKPPQASALDSGV